MYKECIKVLYYVYVFQMLMDKIITSKESAPTDTQCPSHPAPLVPLPSPLPDNITNAIQAVEKIFSDIVNNDTSVCN